MFFKALKNLGKSKIENVLKQPISTVQYSNGYQLMYWDLNDQYNWRVDVYRKKFGV